MIKFELSTAIERSIFYCSREFFLLVIDYLVKERQAIIEKSLDKMIDVKESKKQLI